MKLIKLSTFVVMVLLLAFTGCAKYNGMNVNDIGLKALSLLKTIRGGKVDLKSLNNEDRAPISHLGWNELLSKHVAADGKVSYKGFQTELLDLDQYLNLLSENAPGSNWSEQQKLAYWINAYNAFTVKLILEHYPITSIKNITKGNLLTNSPWDLKFFKIGGVDFDLGTIEHEILRKQFKEPRIHFAINCASFSCPRLLNEAYTAEAVDQQLEDQTRFFINNEDKNLISAASSRVSKIFSWFASDFNMGEDNVKNLISRYHASFNPENKLEYLEYDWSLNE